MAINYTYPVKAVPTVSDNVLIIDNEDTTNPRSTKTATIQSIVNLASGGGGGGVSSVTGTAPVVSSGGTTPAISMAAATTSVNGYLTSTDWNTFNNKLTTVSEDLNPVLSGNLDVNDNSIVSAGGLDIKITPDIGGNVVLSGIKYPQADGTGGQVLQTNGAGQLSFATVSGGTPGGSTTQVQFNNSGAFAGEAAFTYDAALNKLRADQMDSNLSTAKQFTTGTSPITSSGGAATWNAAQGAYGEFSLSENTTLEITNLPVGTPAVLKVTQDVASSFNITAYTKSGGGAVKFPGGTVPTITAAVNSVDIISFIADATHIYASANQDFK